MGLLLYLEDAGSAEPISYLFVDNDGSSSPYTIGKWTGNESWKGHEEKEEAEKRLDFVLGKDAGQTLRQGYPDVRAEGLARKNMAGRYGSFLSFPKAQGTGDVLWRCGRCVFEGLYATASFMDI